MNSRRLLLLFSLVLAASFSGCANDVVRDKSGRKLQLQTIHRPNRQPIYMYRAVNE